MNEQEEEERKVIIYIVPFSGGEAHLQLRFKAI